MLEKARGIVLCQIRYSESSLILHLYTDLWGRTGLMVPGARSRSKGRRTSLYQPLTLLEIEMIHKPNRELQHAREMRIQHPFISIPFDPVKSAVALFLADVLNRTLREEEANPALFGFISSSIQYLDLASAGVPNFHLHFLVNLTRHLGFLPEKSLYTDMSWFDLRSGSFAAQRPDHGECLEPEPATLLYHLLGTGVDQLSSLHLNRHIRNRLLEGMICYYQLHLEGMPAIRSHEVLKQLFD